MKKSLFKNLIIILILLIVTAGCTNNEITKSWGGKQTITLPPNQRLINVTWKETDIWYLTEPMPDDYVPTRKSFKEISTYGYMEGEIIFIETR